MRLWVNFSNEEMRLAATDLFNSIKGSEFGAGLGVSSGCFLISWTTFSSKSSLIFGFSCSGGFIFEWVPLAQPW